MARVWIRVQVINLREDSSDEMGQTLLELVPQRKVLELEAILIK